MFLVVLAVDEHPSFDGDRLCARVGSLPTNQTAPGIRPASLQGPSERETPPARGGATSLTPLLAL